MMKKNLNSKGVPPRPKTGKKEVPIEPAPPIAASKPNPWGVDENKYYVDVGGISDFLNF